ALLRMSHVECDHRTSKAITTKETKVHEGSPTRGETQVFGHRDLAFRKPSLGETTLCPFLILFEEYLLGRQMRAGKQQQSRQERPKHHADGNGERPINFLE